LRSDYATAKTGAFTAAAKLARLAFALLNVLAFMFDCVD